jgi:hypothetical protein
LSSGNEQFIFLVTSFKLLGSNVVFKHVCLVVLELVLTPVALQTAIKSVDNAKVWDLELAPDCLCTWFVRNSLEIHCYLYLNYRSSSSIIYISSTHQLTITHKRKKNIITPNDFISNQRLLEIRA